MSALLNSTINKLRAEADARRVELAELDAGIEALAKIQGGTVADKPRRKGKPPKVKNGVDAAIEAAIDKYGPNSAEANDAKLAAFMTSN